MKTSAIDTISAFVAELLGVGFILFFGCMGCVGNPPHFQVALNFGIAVMASVQIFGFVSGAHFNPAVTAAALIYKKISIPNACLYFVAQMLGAFMGFGLLQLVIPEKKEGLCTTMPGEGVSEIQALTIEFVATAVLILVCCAVWDDRNAHLTDSIALRFGFLIFMLACSAGPFTGASMVGDNNKLFLSLFTVMMMVIFSESSPFLWPGPLELQFRSSLGTNKTKLSTSTQFFINYFSLQQIYWLAPMSAGVVTTYVYKAVFWRPKVEKENQAPEEYALKDNTNS